MTGDRSKEPSITPPGPEWVERWRSAEPALRRECARFVRSTDYSVDDLLGEIAVRMLHAGLNPPKPYDFYRVAQAIGRRVALDRVRDGARRRDVATRKSIALAELADELAREEARGHEEFEQMEWRVALRQAMEHPDLTPAQRRAAMLLLRGGPYSPAERKVLSRAKDTLRDVLEGLFAALPVAWSRLRGRLDAPLAAPLVAAVATAVGIGVFPSSEALPLREAPPATKQQQQQAAAVQAPLAAWLTPPSMPAVADRAPVAQTPHRQQPRPRRVEEPATRAVHAEITVPRGADDGAAEARLTLVPNQGHWGSVTLECNGKVMGSVCSAARAGSAWPYAMTMLALHR